MLTSPERHIRLEAAFNVRDLGGYPTTCGRATRWRSLLRADALHELTDRDVETLLALELRTVIDLRTDKEIARQPSVFAARNEVRYHHISLFDGLAPVDAMFRERGLIDLSERYIEAIESCRPALLRVAATIADAPDGVVLFNCTAGKDRTGIVAAMLLSIAGVAPGDIAADYALTAELAAPLMQRLKEGAIRRGLEEAMATRLLSSERSAMEAFLRYVDERHGGIRKYLVGEPTQQDILTRLEARVVEPAVA
jgi:protein-tyrosine phosphatase